MKSTVERKKKNEQTDSKQRDGDLRSVPSASKKKQKKSLLSMLFSKAEKQRTLLFHIDTSAGVEDMLELIRFASSLRGDHRRTLIAPSEMHSVFQNSGLFVDIFTLPEKDSDKAIIRTLRNEKIDIFLSSQSASFRGVTSIQLKSRSRNYHRFPSFWKALPFAKLLEKGKKNGRKKNDQHMEKADLHLSKHNLRFRITMRRLFEACSAPAASKTQPVWIPVSLDPFTGSPWPFSSYMRLSRMLAQNGIPCTVTIDEKTARETNKKDREVLSGLSAFRKELSLLSKSFNGIAVLEAPSLEKQLTLARFSNIVVGNPSPELLIAQMGGANIIFLHDMLTYRSAHAGSVEELSAHASHGRALFADSLQLSAGLSMVPHVDECVRDCPACSHNYCVDTISPEAVWEELKLLLSEKQGVGQK